MRTTLAPAAAALAALLAGPAFAQQAGGEAQPQPPKAQAGGAGQQQADQGRAGGPGSSEMQAMSQDKLRGSLEKAGFKNVSVLDATYLVRAQDADGNDVMMIINPPSTGGGASADPSGDSASATGGQTGSGPAKGASGS